MLGAALLVACGNGGGEPATTLAAQAEPVGDLVNGVEAPVLGAPHGWHVALAAGGRLFDVDLDTGRIAVRDQAFRYPPRIFATTEGLFVRGLGILTHDLGDVRPADLGSMELRGARTVWRAIGEKGAITIIEVGTDGGVRRSRRLAVDNDAQFVFDDVHPAGVVGDEVVLGALGHIVLVDLSTGVARAWADGSLVGVGGDRIVWRGCDAERRCATYAGTATNPRAVRLDTDATLRVYCGGGAEGGTVPLTCPYSVDVRGATLVADGDPRSSGGLIGTWDLATGAFRAVTWPTSRLQARLNTGEEFGVFDVMLSPDGSWLFGVQTNGRVTAVERATGRAVEFDVIVPVDKAEGLVTAFAVG